MDSIINWTENDVEKWLDNIKLGQYKGKFKEHNITGSVLFDLTHNDLKEMGIESIGERAKILLELKKFFYIILNTRDNSLRSQVEIKKKRNTIIENQKTNYNDLVNTHKIYGINNNKLQSMLKDSGKRQSTKSIIQTHRVGNDARPINPAYLYRKRSIGNNGTIPSIPRKSSLNKNSLYPLRKPSNINMIPRNVYNNTGGIQPFTGRKYSNAGISPNPMNRNMEPKKNLGRNSSINNNNPVRNSTMNKTKSIMNSIKYAPRASILDIYGELSNFFPVKEGDEVLNRARETGKHMSIMMERVGQLNQRFSSSEKIHKGITSLSRSSFVINEEASESEKTSNNLNSKKESATLKSESNISLNNEKMDSDSKIDDILLKDLINSDNMGKKTTVASVYKLVIKSQEKEKMIKSHIQKSIVVKKASKSDTENKDKVSPPALTIEKPSMVSSPLKDNSTLLSPVSTVPSDSSESKPVKRDLVIKTKINSPICSAQIIHSSSPSSASSGILSPSSSQLRKVSDIESGNMSDELKHRTSHIMNIKTSSDQKNVNLDLDNVMLVSPASIMHATLDFPIKSNETEDKNKTKDDKEETKKEENKTKKDKIESDNDTTKTDKEPEKIMEEKDMESEEYNEKPIKWIKGKLIGQGSFGKVYYGMNTENNQIMAVKQVDIKNKKMVEALNAEIDFMKDLRHENIVHYYGSEYGESFNVFLEYVSGGSVASMLSRFGKFTEPLIKSLTSQILSGMEYLHNKSIIHRDIKGANILVDEDGIAKISDFGISKRNEYEKAYKFNSRMSGFKGTVYWMAPEVVKGRGYSAKVDIWSVGCCVLEMFTGTHPWTGFSEAQPVIYKLCTMNRPAIPDSIGEVAKEFIDSALSINPDKRPTASELLTHQFVVEQDESFDFHEYYTEALKKEEEEENAQTEEDRIDEEDEFEDDDYEDIDEFEEDDEVDDYFEEEEVEDYFDESNFDDDNENKKENDINNDTPIDEINNNNNNNIAIVA